MRFIPGNYYKARNGQKALFMAYVEKAFNAHMECIFEYFPMENIKGEIAMTHKNGRYFCSSLDNSKDIIGEWEDEIKPIEHCLASIVPINEIMINKINEIVLRLNKLENK